MREWIERARQDIGLTEIPGPKTNSVIAGWLKRLRAWWSDDETPWCGTAVAAWMTDCGIEPPAAWYRAKSWATWGQPLLAPVFGCVVVFSRDGGGHVGICVGQTPTGDLRILGGNQGNRVSVASFPMARAIAFRWPPGRDLPPYEPLTVAFASPSASEA